MLFRHFVCITILSICICIINLGRMDCKARLFTKLYNQPPPPFFPHPMETSSKKQRKTTKTVYLAEAATSIIFVATKQVFCCDKKYACHDKTFVTANVILSQQKFGCDQHTLVVTKDMFCLNKSTLVMTTLLSRQNDVCWDKYLWQQAYFWYLWQLRPVIKMCVEKLTWIICVNCCVTVPALNSAPMAILVTLRTLSSADSTICRILWKLQTTRSGTDNCGCHSHWKE